MHIPDSEDKLQRLYKFVVEVSKFNMIVSADKIK